MLDAMRVQILLFAGLKERAGSGEIEMELPDGSLVSDALQQLGWLTGDMRVVMAVNREYASAEHALAPGDELALIPPVSGGSIEAPVHVRISAEPLSPEQITARVSNTRAGAGRDLPRCHT